jgi:hypothetical protein
VLTVNGKAEVVLQDAASYQAMPDRLHHMKTLAAIQEGMASRTRRTETRRPGACRDAGEVWPFALVSPLLRNRPHTPPLNISATLPREHAERWLVRLFQAIHSLEEMPVRVLHIWHASRYAITATDVAD